MSIGIVVQVPKTSAGCEREELERGVRAAYCCGKGQGKAAWPSQKKKKKKRTPPALCLPIRMGCLRGLLQFLGVCGLERDCAAKQLGD